MNCKKCQNEKEVVWSKGRNNKTKIYGCRTCNPEMFKAIDKYKKLKKSRKIKIETINMTKTVEVKNYDTPKTK